jgi:hypothetical protein
MLQRILAIAFVLSGGLTQTAAADVTVAPSIAGAGTISALTRDGTRSCDQLPPVSDATVMQCAGPAWEWRASTSTAQIQASPAAGWEFAGWTGCPIPVGTVCSFLALPGHLTPRASFEDRTPPAAVGHLSVRPHGDIEGNFKLAWTEPERGLRYRCAIGTDSYWCLSGLLFGRKEGVHKISVHAVDKSGNAGPAATLELTVVETVLRAAQPRSPAVRAASFSAQSGVATAFECSIDHGAWFACGTPAAPNALTELKLPGVPDGLHTLRVRGSRGMIVDPSPANGAWTLDTTPPETTLVAVDGRLNISSNETGELRCRVDNRPFELCGPSHVPADLGPGTHSFEAYAIDTPGNADPTPAKHTWTIAPPARPAPVPTPAAPRDEAIAEPIAHTPLATAAPALAEPQRPALALRYRVRNQRVMRLAVDGIPAGAKLVVTVKRPGKRRTTTSIAKLVGTRLPAGTRITVRAGDQSRTITIRKGA